MHTSPPGGAMVRRPGETRSQSGGAQCRPFVSSSRVVRPGPWCSSLWPSPAARPPAHRRSRRPVDPSSASA